MKVISKPAVAAVAVVNRQTAITETSGHNPRPPQAITPGVCLHLTVEEAQSLLPVAPNRKLYDHIHLQIHRATNHEWSGLKSVMFVRSGNNGEVTPLVTKATNRGHISYGVTPTELVITVDDGKVFTAGHSYIEKELTEQTAKQ
jgi:hypothetical protein